MIFTVKGHSPRHLPLSFFFPSRDLSFLNGEKWLWGLRKKCL